MRLFSEFMEMLANKPEVVYDTATRVRLPDGRIAEQKRIPISEINFKCVVCQKSYPATTNGGYISDEDTWTCPKCVTPEQAVKAKAFQNKIKTEAQATKNPPGFKHLILDLLEQAHYFMISPGSVFASPDEKGPSEIDLDVAPPFQTCWFQFPEPSQGFEGFKFRSDEVVYGMFIHEVSPQRYLFAMVLKDKADPDLLRLRGGFASESDDHDIWHTIAFWLQPFANGNARTGIERVNERFKYKCGGEKKLLKIKKVVYVFPKKLTAELKSEAEKRHIDFSHRFEVRAHWRNLGPGKVGKNRAGEYCVLGKTFVLEGVKGPEHLPLVKKTRIVLGDKKDGS